MDFQVLLIIWAAAVILLAVYMVFGRSPADPED